MRYPRAFLVTCLLAGALSSLVYTQTEIRPASAVNGAGVAIQPILLLDGSAAAPALAFASEPASGFYRVGSNQIGWSVAGVVHGILTGYKTQLIPNTLTGSLAISALTIDQTWNTTGAPTALKVTITDTASDAASLAMQILGGASGTTNLFKVDKAGVGSFGGSVSSNGAFIVSGFGSLGFASDGVANLKNTGNTGFSTLNLGPTTGNTANGTLQISKITVLCTIATDTNCSGKGTGTITITGAGNLIPAGSMVIGVTSRVTTTIAGSDGIASWTLGTATDPDAWGAGLALAATTTSKIDNFTVTGPAYYTSATAVTFSGTGGKIIDSGAISITIYYVNLIPIGV